ncbi:MAG: ferredoxin [Phycisphaerales bacterium]|nr:ferredoxin [Phycisphaerales bacterium]
MSSTDVLEHETEESPLIDLEGLHFPAEEPLPEGCTNHDILQEARRFHAGDPSVESVKDPELLPAVMHTLRRPSLIRTDYPLVLLPDGNVQPLVEFFAERIAEIEGSKILSDNLVRVERQVRESLVSVADAAKVIGSSGAKVADKLSLNEAADLNFRTKGAELVTRIPEGTLLVPCNASAGPAVAQHIIEAHTRNNTLRERAIKMRDALKSMNSQELSVEAAGINTAKLQEVLGKTASGSVPMTKERADRITHAANTIDQWLGTSDCPLLIVHSTSVQKTESPHSAEKIDAGDELCLTAIKTFDDYAERYAALFAAMRTGRLELAAAFESPRHDHLLDNFCRRSFSDEELLAMPRIVAIGTVQDGISNMASLSAILRSARPITLLLLGDDLATLDHERIELAYLAVAHRTCFATQTSIAHPNHLVASVQQGIASARPAIHTIASEDTHPLGAWLEGNAAIEGRACPLLRYDPSRGNSWADRFEVQDNPQPEHDWPVWTGEVDGQELQLSFTFAHCAMLSPELQKYFMKLPDGFESDDLCPVESWLHVAPEDASKLLPFLWAADSEGAIHKVIIARTVTDVCRERLDYWSTLRELAGFDNSYVAQALAAEREVMQEAFETERETLQNDHASEIETIRTSASQVAMQQLAEVLLGGGGSLVNPMAMVGSTPPPVSAPSANGSTVVEPSSETQPLDEHVVENETELEDLGDPWIDSPLCTTCNDCMEVNAQVFVYNDDKQAYIKDATAGTFEEIVRAAEACPARCIHPGSPLNAAEPNLDDLIKRAAEFN